MSEGLEIVLEMAALRRARLCPSRRADADAMAKKALDAVLCTKEGEPEHRRKWLSEALAWGVLALEAMEIQEDDSALARALTAEP